MYLAILEEGLVQERADFKIENLIAAIANSNYIQQDLESRSYQSAQIGTRKEHIPSKENNSREEQRTYTLVSFFFFRRTKGGERKLCAQSWVFKEMTDLL